MKTVFRLSVVTVVGFCLTQLTFAELSSAGNVVKDVVYKSVGGQDVLLDIYYPAEQKVERPPLFYYTHGGGWWAGSKELDETHQKIFNLLLDAGTVCVSADYRYAAKGTAEFPVHMRDCVIDARDGLRYLKKNEKELGIDASKVVTFGSSAGGHLSLMLNYSAPDAFVGDAELAAFTVRPLGGVSWSGPADFTDSDLFVPAGIKGSLEPDRFTNRIKTGSAKLSYQEADDKLKAMMREVSPIQYMTADSPPILQIHGDRDGTIPLKHGQLLEKKAASLGASVQLITVKGAGHSFGGNATPTAEEIINTTVEFALEHLSSRPDKRITHVRANGAAGSPEQLSDIEHLVTLAWGNGRWGLHRGHTPILNVLEAFLGISHKEMHVYMDDGQNLAGVCKALGLDPKDLVESLTASLLPSIKEGVANGVIAKDEAEAWIQKVREHFYKRVHWDG